MPTGSPSQPPHLRIGGSEPVNSAAQEHQPLSESDFDQIRLGARRAKSIEKVVRYASFSGWTTLLAGGLSLPFSLGNPPMIIFSLAIAGIGTRELTLRRSLKVLDPKAPAKLAINQLMLGGALMIYAIYMLAATPGQTMIESAMEADPMIQSTPELAGMMDDLVVFEQMATALIYVAMIFIAFIFQGGTALYYFLKGSKLRKMRQNTPDWVLRVYQTVHG